MAEIHNPNLQPQGSGGSGNGGDMRSMMTLTLLALVVLLGVQFFKPKQPAAPVAGRSQSQSQSQAQNPSQSQQAVAATGQQSQAAPGAAPAISATAETETTIENPQYKIVFTNRGAQVKHWILKRYFDTAGKPLDMVQPQATASFGLPLSFFTYEPALTQQLNQGLYQLTVSGAQPTATGHADAPATNALTFHYAANGLDVLKTVRFDSSYVITVEAQVRRNGQLVRSLISWPAGLGDMEEFASAHGVTLTTTRQPSQFAWAINGKPDSMASAKVSGNATLDQSYDYAGIIDLYFASVFLPEAPERATLVTLHNTIDLPSVLSDPNSAKKPADVLGVAIGDTSGYTRVRLYAGPKEMDVLSSIHAANGQTLEPLIQFGWLTVIAKPLYLALRFLRHLLGPGAYNWGWAIIIVTVIFNLALLPTRLMMMKSSLKMMRIQPKVEALKRKYAHLKATDPKRAEMNAEMMALYKTEGVNMYGSCLPMLLQMPLFFAYYRVLLNAVELRQAHWFWLTDLSSPDPLHILPILIILSMFLVQYMTPSPGMDPAQRRMMAIMMPVIFGFSMWHFASGLALYWGTGNLINMAIQLGINQSSIGKEMHALAAKRAIKKAGGNPKVIQGRR